MLAPRRKRKSSSWSNSDYYELSFDSEEDTVEGEEEDSLSSNPTSYRLDQFGTLYLVFEYIDTDLQKITRSDQYLELEHVQYVHPSQTRLLLNNSVSKEIFTCAVFTLFSRFSCLKY